MRVLFIGLVGLFLQMSSVFALDVAGTGDSELLLQRLATEYHRLHPDLKVEVPPSVGSSGGIRLLLQGRTDLARVARPLSEKEVKQGLVWRKFAAVPVVFVANLPQTCITDLSSKQLIHIFSGEYRNWSQLGNCPEKKIYLAKREAGDSSNRVIYQKIKGLREVTSNVGKTIYTTGEAFSTINSHPYTLGYLPLAQVIQSSLVRFSIDGISANPTTIINDSYGLQLPLALVWKGPLQREAEAFIRFLDSPQAQGIVESFGAVPVSISQL